MKPTNNNSSIKDLSPESVETADEKVRWTLYPAWCKRCGNCIAFCPTHAVEPDSLGYPHVPEPTKCTHCHLCEKLCPDFAITLGEEPHEEKAHRSAMPSTRTHETQGESPSPERLAHDPPDEESENE